MISPNLSDAAVSWLQCLFRERLAVDLILARDMRGLCVRVQGNNQVIRLLDVASPSEVPHGYLEVGCGSELELPLGRPLPLPQFDPSSVPTPIVRDDSGFTVSGGVPWVVFWALNRLEEKHALRDTIGRTLASGSHAHAHGYLLRPFVDEWIHLIGQMAAILWPTLKFHPICPRVDPSHDVDYPSQYAYIMPSQFVRALGRTALHQRNVLAALRGIQTRISAGINRDRLTTEPYNTFEWLMDQSEEQGVPSTFYFLCGGRDRHDPGYSPEHPAIRRLMRRIHDRGHVIGLHPSFQCVDDDKMFTDQFTTLLRVADREGIRQHEWGARMHYLRCRYPHSFRQFQRLGIAHDATMGYADQIGFRAGTCFPYEAFDAEADCSTGVRVRPLLVMEGTLYSRGYMGLTDQDECVAHVQKVHEATRAVGGVMTLLWHNSEVATAWGRSLYRRVLTLAA